LKQVQKKPSHLKNLFHLQSHHTIGPGHALQNPSAVLEEGLADGAKTFSHPEAEGEKEDQVVDLTTLLPEKFSEIPYITQINTKKQRIEQFNQCLEKLLQKSPGSY
jgi:hypothetical protein